MKWAIVFRRNINSYSITTYRTAKKFGREIVKTDTSYYRIVDEAARLNREAKAQSETKGDE